MDGHTQFPTTSLSRTTGARLQPSSTQESHPLGSSPPPGDIAGSNSLLQAQKYKPYTPRTRVVPATTTNTLVHPPSPSPVAGEDATSKLQLTKARSEAQNLGLDTSSVGWAILDKVVAESETGELWTEVWSSITSGKATILLPAEPLSTHDRLTPEFLKDHIAYCDVLPNEQAQQATPIVTLSGLRGTIHGTSLTFSTSLHPSSPAFQTLRDPVTRSSALAKLPSLSSAATSLENSTYPEFRVLNGPTTLPLPPRVPVPSKPPLPPRPGARPLASATGSPAPPAQTSSSRIPNPFASLFGGGGHRHSTSSSSTSGVFGSPSPSLRSNDSLPTNTGADPASQTIEVSAIVIDEKVDRKVLGKSMNDALSKGIKAMLSGKEVPKWVALRVTEFCQPWFPFVRAPKIISASLSHSAKKLKEDKDRDTTISSEWTVNQDGTDGEGFIEDKMDFLQEFYMQLEEGLRVDLGSNSGGDACQNGDIEKEEMEKIEESDTRVRNIMELVERTICSLLYDRLFMQPQTDDAQHDTALSNRVAALNLLDLTLEHLDIQIGEASSLQKINTIVRACGQRLSDLDTVHAPKDKASILVDAHQIVVDGLSKLPPVRLMSAEESKALRERLQQQAVAAAANARDNNNVTPPIGPQVLLTTSSPEVYTTIATPTATTPTPTTAESTTLLTSAEGGSPPATGRNTEMPPAAELSPLSFATKETLSSSSPSRPSSLDLSASPDSQHSDNNRFAGDGDSQKESRTRKAVKATPVSSDILLPMIIFSVVKCNPPHLVSNLLYTQRFRNQSAFMREGNGGESFCVINLMAVAEFLENVDLEGLGLGSAEDTSAAQLSPIIARAPTPLPTSASSPTTPKVPASGTPLLSGIDLRGRVEQRVDALAGSANKVFSGVVDSSFGILKSFLPHQQHEGGVVGSTAIGPDGKSMMIVGEGAGAAGLVEVPPATAKQGQGFGLLRRETSGFSIASIISRTKVQQQGEDGQQLMDVGSSRPGSIKSFIDEESGSEDEDEDGDEDSDEEDGEEEEEDEESSDGEEGDGGEEDNADMRSDYSAFGESGDDENRAKSGVNIPGIQITSKSSSPYMSKGPSQSASSFGTDTRSIRSFESMMSDNKKRQQQKQKMKMKKKIKQKVKKANERERKEREKEEKNFGGRDGRLAREPRKSISDRLASVSALVGGLNKASSTPPESRRSSLLLQPPPNVVAPLPVPARLSPSPSSSRAPSPSSRSPSPLLKTMSAANTTTARVREPSSDFPLPLPLPRASTLPPAATAITSQTQTQPQPQFEKQSLSLPQPNRRFMECTGVEELRIAEVAELLEEYRRLVEGVRGLGLI